MAELLQYDAWPQVKWDMVLDGKFFVQLGYFPQKHVTYNILLLKVFWRNSEYCAFKGSWTEGSGITHEHNCSHVEVKGFTQSGPMPMSQVGKVVMSEFFWILIRCPRNMGNLLTYLLICPLIINGELNGTRDWEQEPMGSVATLLIGSTTSLFLLQGRGSAPCHPDLVTAFPLHPGSHSPSDCNHSFPSFSSCAWVGAHLCQQRDSNQSWLA